MPLLLALLRVFCSLRQHWDKFLINFFEIQILVHLELTILAERIF